MNKLMNGCCDYLGCRTAASILVYARGEYREAHTKLCTEHHNYYRKNHAITTIGEFQVWDENGIEALCKALGV